MEQKFFLQEDFKIKESLYQLKNILDNLEALLGLNCKKLAKFQKKILKI